MSVVQPTESVADLSKTGSDICIEIGGVITIMMSDTMLTDTTQLPAK